MERKLSLGSWRRSSKASRDGSLSENMAKPAIKASPRGISTSPARGSEILSNRERISWNRESADRPLRAFLAEKPMAGNSVCAGEKIVKLGKDYVSCLYERCG